MTLRLIPQIDNIIFDQVLKTDKHYKFKNIYPKNAKLYLHNDVIDSLINVANYAYDNYGYKLCIFDAYRPLRYQLQLLGNETCNFNYVSSPNVAYHCRGIAIDVAFFEGNVMLSYPPMTHEKNAHHYVIENLTDEQIKNREILKEVMERFGFEHYEYEWWHYNFANWNNYKILDIDFDELEKHE